MLRISLKEAPIGAALAIDMELSLAFDDFSGCFTNANDVANLTHYRAVFEACCINYDDDKVEQVLLIAFTVHPSINHFDRADPLIFHTLHGVAGVDDNTIEIQIVIQLSVQSMILDNLQQDSYS